MTFRRYKYLYNSILRNNTRILPEYDTMRIRNLRTRKRILNIVYKLYLFENAKLEGGVPKQLFDL